MSILRLLNLLIAGAFSFLTLQAAPQPAPTNPFHEAEESFIAELNSMAGIELLGGPFHSSEQHHFDRESGYFILAPAVPISTLDQRLTVQTKNIDVALGAALRTNTLPIAASAYTVDAPFTPTDRREVHGLLTQYNFATRRDEITILDEQTIHLRPVSYLPILKILGADNSAPNPPTALQLSILNARPIAVAVLLGSQPWQGIPLYRASFDRTRGDYELERVREGFVPRRPAEFPQRASFIASQTFFAEPGLAPADWTKVLRNFAALDLPAQEILEATLSDRTVTLYADTERPILPQYWIKLEKQSGLTDTSSLETISSESSQWKLTQAVEFRAEFPRPGSAWSFLPLLSSPARAPHDAFPESKIPPGTRLEISTLVPRLRGVGHLTSLTTTNNHQTIHARTTHDPSRGYHLELTRLQNTWRLTSISESTQ